MARYSFCVKDKSNPKKVLCLDGKYDLPFLVYFIAQFNNEKELLKFLGLNPNEYESIKIGYKVEKTLKLLPIYFDAPILEKISKSMIDFEAFFECGNVYEEIALAYKNPQMLKIAKKVPRTREAYTIVEATLNGPKPKAGFLNNEALDHYSKYNAELYQTDGDSEYHRDKFTKELMSSYIQIYKAYAHLRANGLIRPEIIEHNVPNYTMKEIIDSYGRSEMSLIYEILKGLNLTEYEEILVNKILNGDENAYEELKNSDVETVERLMPLIRYLDGIR